MEYELDSMMGFDKLGLYYDVHMAGIDEECFNYSIYFKEGITDEKIEETDKAINEFMKPYNDKEIYLGYIEVSKIDDKVNVYLDLGKVAPEDEDTAIKGILKALNNISGINSVIVNEDCDFDYKGEHNNSRKWRILIEVLILLASIALLYISFTNIPYVNKKPVIYLYPEKEMQIDVSLDFSEEKLVCTYPKYKSGWKVTAKIDGTLVDRDGKKYSYLFWESKAYNKYDMSEGFLVKGDDSARFLEEKLSYLGLNVREQNDFITYWLPALEKNEYNIIKFAQEEYTDQYPIHISPQPDSMLRVFMVFQKADGDESIKEQVLKPWERTGFAVVEWGGANIKE